MWRWLLLGWFVTVLCLGQTDDRRRYRSKAFEEGRSVQNKITTCPWHFGSFHVTPLLGVKQLGYDDNVFSEAVSETKDFSISPELGLQTYWRLSPNWVFANRGTYNYVYYNKLDALRGSEYGGESKLYGLFKRFYFDLGINFRRDRGRNNSEIDERVYSRQKSIDFSVIYQPTPRGYLGVEGRLRNLEFEDSGDSGEGSLSRLERDQSGVALEYLYKLRALFWPFVELAHDQFDFASPDNPRDDSSFTSLQVGVRNEQDTRFHFDVKGGVYQLRFDGLPGEGNPDSDVPALRTFFDYNLTRRFYVDGGLTQDPIFSRTGDYNYFLSRRGSLGIGYISKRKIRFGPEFILGENDYEKPIRPVAIRRNDRIRRYNFVVQIPTSRNMNWNITAGFSERDSNLAGLDDEGFQIFSELKYQFDR